MSAPNENPGSSRKSSSTEFWIKLAVPVIGLVGVVAGLWVNRTISERAERANSARLVTELLSRREEAESALRKDMFGTIFAGFLESTATGRDGATPDSMRLSDGLLKLELLSLNFGETLSLGPLFAEMNRRIHTDSWYPDAATREIDRARYQRRLESLARRVADRQLAALAPESDQGVFSIEVPTAEAEDGATFTWRGNGGESQDADPPGSCLLLDDVKRFVTARFSGADPTMKTVQVQLDLTTATVPGEMTRACREAWLDCQVMPDGCPAPESEPSRPIRFRLDPFNFPMIDNALLSHDQRLALVMSRFDDVTIQIDGVLFPGQFASRRDKPSLPMAVRQLEKATLSPGGP